MIFGFKKFLGLCCLFSVGVLQAQTTPLIKYITYRNGEAVANEISSQRWLGANGGFSAGGRQDFLIKLFYANTRELSNSGLKHAACFEGGTAQEIQKYFFNKKNTAHFVRGLVGNVAVTKASSDGFMLGIGFTMTPPGQNEPEEFYFRLPHCLAGKAAIDETVKVELGSIENPKIKYSPVREIASADGLPQGFSVSDKLAVPAGMNLPRFVLRADYDSSPLNEVFPWKNADVRTEAGALKLAFILQKYIYENMANQDLKNPDMNFIASKNTSRYFCQTPWLNVGPAGREGIHGMTKERDLKPAETMDVYANATPGSDWGVSFYNSQGCKTINSVYGSVNKPLAQANFKNANFGEGSFSAKLLFTTSNYNEIKDAYTWHANVSESGSNYRSIKSVRHIQMDVTVRDSSIKGSNPALNNWIMYTWYYDPGFDYDKEYKSVLGENPLKKITGIPASLLKMRPMGVQTGFGKPSTKESIIFAGAQTNGFEGRLNGPADNSKGSCLSCHATAGTGVKMVPGFMSNSEFKKGTGYLDFSQQFALGKRNLETVIPDKKK